MKFLPKASHVNLPVETNGRGTKTLMDDEGQRCTATNDTELTLTNHRPSTGTSRQWKRCGRDGEPPGPLLLPKVI